MPTSDLIEMFGNYGGGILIAAAMLYFFYKFIVIDKAAMSRREDLDREARARMHDVVSTLTIATERNSEAVAKMAAATERHSTSIYKLADAVGSLPCSSKFNVKEKIEC